MSSKHIHNARLVEALAQLALRNGQKTPVAIVINRVDRAAIDIPQLAGAMGVHAIFADGEDVIGDAKVAVESSSGDPFILVINADETPQRNIAHLLCLADMEPNGSALILTSGFLHDMASFVEKTIGASPKQIIM